MEAIVDSAEAEIVGREARFLTRAENKKIMN
jgi:hypothetical protein